VTDADARVRVYRWLLIVAVVESFIHYTDNVVEYSDYRNDPLAVFAWINRPVIVLSWLAFVGAGLLAYRRMQQHDFSTASFWIGVFSISGLISVLHYTDIGLSDLNAFQNTFVFADVALGVALLVFAIDTARRASSLSARSTSSAP
jgi:hypothetical protein